MTPTRLKFELIEPQQAAAAARLRREEPRAPERPRVMQELAEGLEFLIGQLSKAEEERDRARAEAERHQVETSRILADFGELQHQFQTVNESAVELRETRKTLENVVAEQQRALLLSMELVHRFEDEVAGLRKRMDTMEAAPPPPDPAILDELRKQVDHHRAEQERSQAEMSALQGQLDAALEESAKLREALAEQTKLGDPTAAIRALEEQRDAARAEAVSARADLSIQSAELETKDAIISALERALEQQQGSLRSLEERFAAYATRLQELRIERLTMPKKGRSEAPDTGEDAPPDAAPRGLLSGFKRLFSPPPAKADTPTEDSAR